MILQLRAEQQKLADRIEHEIDNVIANLENDVALARSRERAHAEQLREAKGQSAVTGQAEVQLREMEREVAASRSLYETLLVRLKETEQQQEIVQADARLISPAQTPDAPSSPSPKLFAMVGFTASLVLGSILALLLEQLDNTLRTGRQVEELLGLPSLGLVPKVADARAGARLHRHMIDQPQSRLCRGGPRALHPGLPRRRRAAAARHRSSSPRPCPAKARPRSPRASPCSPSSSATGRCSSTSTSAAPPSPESSRPGRRRTAWRCSPAPSVSRRRSCATRTAGSTCWPPATATATRSPC